MAQAVAVVVNIAHSPTPFDSDFMQAWPVVARAPHWAQAQRHRARPATLHRTCTCGAATKLPGVGGSDHSQSNRGADKAANQTEPQDKKRVLPLAGLWAGGPMGVFAGVVLAKKLTELPSAPGTKHEIPCIKEQWNGIDRHGMGNTLMSFHKMLRDAEADLRQQTGVQCTQAVIV